MLSACSRIAITVVWRGRGHPAPALYMGTVMCIIYQPQPACYLLLVLPRNGTAVSFHVPTRFTCLPRHDTACNLHKMYPALTAIMINVRAWAPSHYDIWAWKARGHGLHCSMQWCANHYSVRYRCSVRLMFNQRDILEWCVIAFIPACLADSGEAAVGDGSRWRPDIAIIYVTHVRVQASVYCGGAVARPYPRGDRRSCGN